MNATEFFQHWYPWIVTIASAVASVYKPKEGSAGAAAMAVVNVLAYNFGNARNMPAAAVNQIKMLAPFALLFALGLQARDVDASSLLTWTLPTTVINGEALAPGDLTAITVTRAGSAPVVLPGTATSFLVSNCKAAGEYGVTATAFGLVSDPAAITVPIDQVGCRPKPVSGLTF